MKILKALSGLLLVYAFCPAVAWATIDANGEGGEAPGQTNESTETTGEGQATLVFSCPSPTTSNIGLTWDGTHLWIASNALDTAYRVDPFDCSIVHSIPLPSPGYPTGLAWDGRYLWSTDGDLETIFQLDPLNGSIISSFPSPGEFPNGLTFDGINLWDTDTNCVTSTSCTPDEIHKLTTEGDVLSTFPAIGTFPSGLAYDGVHLWHSDNILDSVYKLDSTDLSILFAFPSPGTFPNDLAWDGQFLWVIDNGTNFLYQYDVTECGDGILDPDEECDDGNNIDGDGCASDCTNEGGGGQVPAVSDLAVLSLVLLLLTITTAALLWRRRSAA